jgi:hypothetical protein
MDCWINGLLGLGSTEAEEGIVFFPIFLLGFEIGYF